MRTDPHIFKLTLAKKQQGDPTPFLVLYQQTAAEATAKQQQPQETT